MQLSIEQNQKEIKKHGSFAFPVNISKESIATYEQGCFLWHWHPEIELTLFTHGHMEYHVNDQIYHVSANEGLFGNSNTLHAGFQEDGAQCSYTSITFHPRFLYGYEKSILQTGYISPITEDADFSSLHLYEDGADRSRMLELMRRLVSLNENPAEDYELQVHLLLMELWQSLYHYYRRQKQGTHKIEKSMERLRMILSYLQDHYAEEVSLDDVAAHTNLCKSECCRFFKKHIHMTIFEYLMYLRIEKSLPLLRNGASITEAASASGFSTSAYYGKIFHRYMHCTPSEYRKKE